MLYISIVDCLLFVLYVQHYKNIYENIYVTIVTPGGILNFHAFDPYYALWYDDCCVWRSSHVEEFYMFWTPFHALLLLLLLLLLLCSAIVTRGGGLHVLGPLPRF